MDKAEELKQKFLQNYTPGNYTDAEFDDMVNDFERDLNEYAQQESREAAIGFGKCLIREFMKGTFEGKHKKYNDFYDEWHKRRNIK